MTITVTVNAGNEFGTDGKISTDTKVFTSIVEYDSYVSLLESFDAADEIIAVKWDCK